MKTDMLVINASPYRDGSRSFRMFRQLMADALEGHFNPIRVTHLADDADLRVSADYAAALRRPPSEAAGRLDRSEAFIRDLERADALVILTPMHNLAVPAVLKCWIDHVVRKDRSFRSSPTGKVGLLHDRPTLVVVTSGGFHRGARTGQKDFLSPYLTEILAIVGIRAVDFAYLQGTVLDPVAAEGEERGVEAELKAWLDRQSKS